MDDPTKNLKQKKATEVSWSATQSITAGNIHTAWRSLNKAIGLVSELIEDTVEHDDDN